MIKISKAQLGRKRGTFNESVQEIDFCGRAIDGKLF
jgi:hypothetical protein